MLWIFVAEPQTVSGQEKKVPSTSDVGGEIHGDDEIKKAKRPSSPGRKFHPQWPKGGHSIYTNLHLAVFTHTVIHSGSVE